MPAVNRVRLEKQIAALQAQLAEPQSFVRQVNDLLAFYADPTRRAGQSGIPAPLLKTFHAPPQVVRTLTLKIIPWVQAQPHAGLAVVDALWVTGILESRRIAADLLGAMPPEVMAEVFPRLDAWLQATPEAVFQAELIARALQNMRHSQPLAYADWIEARLASADAKTSLHALQAIRVWVEERTFDNFPLVFRWLRSLGGGFPPALRGDLLAVLSTLAARAPQETAHFLNALLKSHDSPQTRALVQRARAALPPAWRNLA
ncbi:MAG: hypothetical protein Fur0018_19000 [Anaerolineales bacterium]